MFKAKEKVCKLCKSNMDYRVEEVNNKYVVYYWCKKCGSREVVRSDYTVKRERGK